LLAVQDAYKKTGENYFRLTSVGIKWDIFFPLYNQVWKEAYTLHNIHQAFAATGIKPLNSRTVLANAKDYAALNKAAQDEALLSVDLDKTPYTKCKLRLHTNQEL
jgi:hypothetical protein